MPSYGITAQEFDTESKQNHKLFQRFPDLLDVQLLHFIYRHDNRYQQTFPRMICKYLCQKKDLSVKAYRAHNRIREVIKARERVDMKQSQEQKTQKKAVEKQATKEHEALQKTFTHAYASKIKKIIQSKRKSRYKK